MPVILILLVTGLMLLVTRMIYQKGWSRGLSADVHFSDRYLFEGCSTKLVENVSNRKWLPLPWLHVKYEIARNGNTANLFKNDVMNILFHQKITRSSPITLKERGVYTIDDVVLISFDLFLTKRFAKVIRNRPRSLEGTSSVVVYPVALEDEEIEVPFEKLTGELTTRRFTLEDPYLFKGLREYRPEDSFRNINFKASAKNGVDSGANWLVNMHEYTVDQFVNVILLTDKASNYYEEQEYEKALRYAAAMLTRLIRQGIPAALVTNAPDSLDGTEASLASGLSEGHIQSALEVLARLDIDKTVTPGPELIESLVAERDTEEYDVIICPDHTEPMLRAYQNLRGKTQACLFVSPVSLRTVSDMTEEEKALPDKVENFYYYEI